MLTRLPERPFRPADPRTANRAFQQRRQFDRATPLSDRGDFGAAFWAQAGQNTPLVGARYPHSPSLGSGGAARRPRRNSQHIVRRKQIPHRTSRVVVENPHLRPSGTSSYGSKNRSLTTTTRPGGRSAPSQRWRGCGRYVRTAWCCDGLTSATPSVDFSTPRSLCCSGGGSADHPAELQSRGAPQIPLKRPRCCAGDIC